MIKSSIFSFFSGAGFLDLGFEHAGFDVVYVNEVFAPFLSAYKYSRKSLGQQIPKYGYYAGSVENCLNAEEAINLSSYVAKERESKNLIGFIGGPPCPDFSVGGKNRGAEGENGKLSKVYFELICAQKPDFFIFENVKGLWKTNRHRTFYEEMKEMLEANGYLLVEKLINSLEYGVAQDRERIILFGVNGKISDKIISSQFVLDNFNWGKGAQYSNSEMRAFIENDKLPKKLTIQYWFDENDVKSHPNSKHCFVPRAGLSKFQSIEEGDVSKKSYKRLHRNKYSPTAAYGNNEVHIHPTEARRITAAEALAIQSLPKNYALPPEMTLTNMFKVIGNGVPYKAASGIALSVLDFLERLNNDNENNSK